MNRKCGCGRECLSGEEERELKRFDSHFTFTAFYLYCQKWFLVGLVSRLAWTKCQATAEECWLPKATLRWDCVNYVNKTYLISHFESLTAQETEFVQFVKRQRQNECVHIYYLRTYALLDKLVLMEVKCEKNNFGWLGLPVFGCKLKWKAYSSHCFLKVLWLEKVKLCDLWGSLLKLALFMHKASAYLLTSRAAIKIHFLWGSIYIPRN